MKEQIVRQVPLFSDLPQVEILNLVNSLHPLEIPEKTLLFQEGEAGDRFYILIEGEVEIIKALGTNEERLLGVRTAGSLIGEMSLFNLEHTRTASVRSVTPLQLLEMTRQEFDALLQSQPGLAYRMVSLLSTRLAEAENVTIRDLRIKNQELFTAYQELKAAQAQLIEKERLEQEMQVARRIQISMMPRQVPQYPGYLFEAKIQPMRAIGGDFYDFIPIDEDHLGVAVGDVSDHGMPAALFMAMTVTLLRSEATHSLSPVEVLSQVNRLLLRVNDTNMFVTLLYGILSLSTGKFTYARAGHECPITYNEQGVVRKLEPLRGTLLGVIEEISLEEGCYALPPGGTLLIYTDGVMDDLNPEGQAFGLQTLLKTLEELRSPEKGSMCQILLERIQAHRGSAQPFDDITLLTIHAQSQAT